MKSQRHSNWIILGCNLINFRLLAPWGESDSDLEREKNREWEGEMLRKDFCHIFTSFEGDAIGDSVGQKIIFSKVVYGANTN